MSFINQIFIDLKGIKNICSMYAAIKWLIFVFITLPKCIRERNLQPADRLFGEGPISVNGNYGKVKLSGGQVFSSIREIWVRKVYLKDDFVIIPDEGILVDLGANVGSFTMQALSNSRSCKVIAVEPNAEFNRLFLRQIELNNFTTRVTLQRYFIGSSSETQMEMLKSSEIFGAEFISQQKFIELNNLQSIDFLKCDIEGSEFDFINDTSLLEITKQLAIEIHDHAGDRKKFISRLQELGFEIGPIRNDKDGCILSARRNI
ncbi:MAG: FkbM family methyltransferase [bacterium]|nr:FkbM family methyltransferase [bacterium]